MANFEFIEKFYPDRYYDSIFDIDFDLLKGNGIRGLLIDLDNTIIPRDEDEVSEDLRYWFLNLSKKGFKVCIVSNNWKSRVSEIAEELGLPLIARAVKPKKRAFEQGMKLLKTNKNQTAVIGDQVFTDVFGGNRTGLFTILVVPLSDCDLFYTKFLRKLERIILKRIRKEK